MPGEPRGPSGPGNPVKDRAENGTTNPNLRLKKWQHAYRSTGGFSEREKGEPGREEDGRDENKQDRNNDQPTMRLKLTLDELQMFLFPHP